MLAHVYFMCCVWLELLALPPAVLCHSLGGEVEQ